MSELIYYGVVKGSVVVLPEGAQLAEETHRSSIRP